MASSAGWFDVESIEFTIHMILLVLCLVAMFVVMVVYICRVICDKQSGKRDWKPSGKFIPEPSFRRQDSVSEADAPKATARQRLVFCSSHIYARK